MLYTTFNKSSAHESLVALGLAVRIEKQIKNDISIFAISLRLNYPAVDKIKMIQDQARDNYPAMERMFGEKLTVDILKFEV